MKIGIDFGNTIVSGHKATGWTQQPGAFEIIRHWSQRIGPDNLFIISKVVDKETLRMTLEWLKTNDFYDKARFLTNHVHFCQTRQEKAPIAEELEITVHIDDRPEVMAHLDSVATKIIFNADPEDYAKFRSLIKGKVYCAHTWQDVHNALLELMEDKPDKRAGTAC